MGGRRAGSTTGWHDARRGRAKPPAAHTDARPPRAPARHGTHLSRSRLGHHRAVARVHGGGGGDRTTSVAGRCWRSWSRPRPSRLLASLVGRSVEQLGTGSAPARPACCSRRSATCPSCSSASSRSRRGWWRSSRPRSIGSILANLLLVLGLGFVVGGLKHGTQQLGSARARTIVVLMLLSVAAMVIPSLAHLHPRAGRGARDDVLGDRLGAPAAPVRAVAAVLAAPRRRPGPARRRRRGRAAALAARGSRSGCSPWPRVAAAFVSDWFVHGADAGDGRARRSPRRSPDSSSSPSPATPSRTSSASSSPRKDQSEYAFSSSSTARCRSRSCWRRCW